ncbi:MAG: hypothetical protein ABI880_05340 [Acidobacteriota bacterium]
MSALGAAAACSESPASPVSPSAAGGSTTENPDGATLKVTAPVPVSPRGGEQIATRRPELVFTNAIGRFGLLAVQYRIESLDSNGSSIGTIVVAQGAGDHTAVVAEVDLPYDTVHAWRVRAELDGALGPWSTTESFKTPAVPVVAAPDTGAVGPQRTMGIGEAFDILVRIHDELGFDLGSRSTRDDRINFLMAAVAAVHYGHPRFNPIGPDAGWCIKDAGGGRPISDDVVVRCQSRDFWDLIGGVGANGYSWRIAYDGILPGVQNVYPPPRASLAYLNR